MLFVRKKKLEEFKNQLEGKMTAEATAIYTEKKYGAKLCANCATQKAKEIREKEEQALTELLKENENE